MIYAQKKFNVFVRAAIALLVLVTITGFTFLNTPVCAEEKEVKVPINQVVKTHKLSAEQLTKSKVTVPRSWVDQDYLEEHFPQGGESKSQSSISNIPDGTYTQKPEVTSDQSNAIEISNFSFELTYDEGTLLEAKVTFSLKSESEAIEDVRLVLDGDNSLTPTDGAYDESIEDFSYTMKGLEAGNLYRGTLEVSSESSSDSIEFKIYPREFVNIANDDARIIAAHYYPWFTSNGWGGLKYEPSLGNYSSKDEEVINKHIDWATGHGIDTFIMTWNGREDWTDSNIRNTVLESDLMDNISFFIAYGWGGNVGKVDFDKERYRDKFKSDIKYFNNSYFKNPQYLELNGRKPVFLWGSKVFRGNEDKMIRKVRELSNQRGNKLYLIGDELDTVLLENEPWVKNRIEEMDRFDAVSRYNLLYPDFEGTLQDFVDEASEVYSELKPQIDSDFIPYVQPGYDDSRVRPSANNPIIERNKESFRNFCNLAEKYTERGINMILVTSFNEWAESSQVEPAEEYGFKYLEIIKDELAGGG